MEKVTTGSKTMALEGPIKEEWMFVHPQNKANGTALDRPWLQKLAFLMFRQRVNFGSSDRWRR